MTRTRTTDDNNNNICNNRTTNINSTTTTTTTTIQTITTRTTTTTTTTSTTNTATTTTATEVTAVTPCGQVGLALGHGSELSVDGAPVGHGFRSLVAHGLLPGQSIKVTPPHCRILKATEVPMHSLGTFSFFRAKDKRLSS